MVTPVNPDKSVTSHADRATQPKQHMQPEQAQQHAASVESKTTLPAETKVDVESARQLYQMENNRTQATSSRIETPEQAKTLLGQILQQFSAAPDKTLQAQSADETAALVNLLERAPA